MGTPDKNPMRVCSRCGKFLKDNEVCHCIEESMISKLSYENMLSKKTLQKDKDWKSDKNKIEEE